MKKIFLILNCLFIAACTPSCTPAQVKQDVQVVEEVLEDGEQIYEEVSGVKTVIPAKGFRQKKLQRIRVNK